MNADKLYDLCFPIAHGTLVCKLAKLAYPTFIHCSGILKQIRGSQR